jgi:hypothetical protein
VLCTRSVPNTPGLVRGAEVGVLCSVLRPRDPAIGPTSPLAGQSTRATATARPHRQRPLLLAFVLLAATAAGLATGAAPSRALAPPTPWDGSNPFNCAIQDAGFGATGPDPGADPYGVYFDKTQQNVSQLGIVDFLLEEPARTAAAVPKCFYFQEDHWRGSLVQSNGSTVIYEFEGHYFFNKATGDGGVWVTDFTVAGQTFDPTSLPGFPPGYGQDFGPGTGGFITHNDVPADPQCAAPASASSRTSDTSTDAGPGASAPAHATPRALTRIAAGRLLGMRTGKPSSSHI